MKTIQQLAKLGRRAERRMQTSLKKITSKGRQKANTPESFKFHQSRVGVCQRVQEWLRGELKRRNVSGVPLTDKQFRAVRLLKRNWGKG
jgi:hypothetical protein